MGGTRGRVRRNAGAVCRGCLQGLRGEVAWRGLTQLTKDGDRAAPQSSRTEDVIREIGPLGRAIQLRIIAGHIARLSLAPVAQPDRASDF